MKVEPPPPSTSEAIPLIPPSPRLPKTEPVSDPYAEEGRPFVKSVPRMIRDYFLGEDPTFGAAVFPLCILSAVLFTRHPLKTNFIFDEQEALLANPYV